MNNKLLINETWLTIELLNYRRSTWMNVNSTSPEAVRAAEAAAATVYTVESEWAAVKNECVEKMVRINFSYYRKECPQYTLLCTLIGANSVMFVYKNKQKTITVMFASCQKK